MRGHLRSTTTTSAPLTTLDEPVLAGCSKMPAFRFLIILGISIFISGCQIDYLMHSAYHQAKLMNSREALEKTLSDPKISLETKRKLELAKEAKDYAEKTLGLKSTHNYESFVQLEDTHVSYVVQVAKAWELTAYKWTFPIVGSLPYKGYFVKKRAQKEAEKFSPQEYDTYVRGVSAFSTLGWFNDPIYSSMLRYSDEDLVETIIHETVHATIYIKSNADFNERLATFLGQQGVKKFYLDREGAESATLKKIENDLFDQKLFSKFISEELNSLKLWYQEKSGKVSLEMKRARLQEIQLRFAKDLQPKFKSPSYTGFSKQELNNAILLSYKTYLYDLSDFEVLFEAKGRDFKEVIKTCQKLEKEENPEKTLKDLIANP